MIASMQRVLPNKRQRYISPKMALKHLFLISVSKRCLRQNSVILKENIVTFSVLEQYITIYEKHHITQIKAACFSFLPLGWLGKY